MAVGFPAKTNFATGDVLTATNVNDITGTLNLLQETLYPAGRNKIINGDFNVNQRAFTSATTSAVYTFDRFSTTLGGTSGTTTYTPQTFTPGAAPVAGYEGKNFMQMVTASYTVADSWAGFAQPIESVRSFAGQTVVFSFWARATSGTPKLGVRVQQNFGSGGSPSTAVNTYATVAAISTSWARYSVTVAVPSINGKTLGTSGDDRLIITLVSSAGSSTFEGGFGSMLQNNTFQFWGWQVEAASTGSTPSPFQTASGSIGGELALCQRYYIRYAADNIYAIAGLGTGLSATLATIFFSLPVELRANASAIEYSNLSVYDGTSITAVTSATLDNATKKVQKVNATVASGLTAYRPYSVIANGTSSFYIAFTAEL
jgi:hypothetical protein